MRMSMARTALLLAAILLGGCSGGTVTGGDGQSGDDGALLDSGGDGGGSDLGDRPDGGDPVPSDGDGGSDAADGTTTDGDGAGPGIAPWVVFTAADPSVPMSANLLVNPDLESVPSAGTFQGWSAFGNGYQVGAGEGRSGNALKLVRAASDTAAYGAYQSVTLNQAAAKPLYFSGWSQATGVTGNPDSDCSIYIDISYVTTAEDPVHGCQPTPQDPCALYGQVPEPRFDTGTHGWQQRDGFAIPQYPIKRLSFYLLLRGGHSGTVLFDDLVLKEVEAAVLPFEGRIVATVRPVAPYTAGAPLQSKTGDGLSLSVWSGGGALSALQIDGADVFEQAFDYGSGFFLHDMETNTWIAPGGSVVLDGQDLLHTAVLDQAQLSFQARYQPLADRLAIRADLTALDSRERAVTLYFALPVLGPGWTWGDDIRDNRPVSGAIEMANTIQFWSGPIGATGAVSRFPFGTVFDASRGLVVGYPLDQTRLARLVMNPVTRQLYAAIDLGMSPAASRFPSQAWAELVLFRTSPTDPRYGFRAALSGFYDRFPDAFSRRVPPAREGIWVAFADLSQVQNAAGESVEDFNVGFHELGSVSMADFDVQHGILAFRYIIEPASTWLQIHDAGVDVSRFDQVTAYLLNLYATGSGQDKVDAEKTLSSGIYDAQGHLEYDPYTDGPPWCPGKCALFYLDPDPDISVPPYTLNQASVYWNDQAKQAYTAHPGLSGEYIDSYVMEATRPNYRSDHFAACDTPLTFTFDSAHRVVVPIIFSTLEFTRWLRADLPAGKFLIANGMLIGVPWGADLFDFMGEEVDWVQLVGGQYTIVPDEEWLLSYRRAMAGKRPYGFLMNTDFANFGQPLVERYMRLCLFYGIYPSMFSANASQGNYFETPALYERDRALFKKYVPLIRQLNTGGWEPLTRAVSSNDQVLLERFGSWPDTLFFTLRSLADTAQTTTLTLDRAALGMDAGAVVHSLLLGNTDVTLASGQASIDLTLPPGEIEALSVTP